ncbi:hypothetical protein B0J11DRAFT_563193 [Dendryphion nanum]|uniref:Uncharacterized protein n=1 Tax=Dendryphion nanum TaxID=256645 RepID=A0A9P9IZS9_9PLEO|nr:hypothetical protein B0J11DRAFT_563193 [Dendryphion nanum]
MNKLEETVVTGEDSLPEDEPLDEPLDEPFPFEIFDALAPEQPLASCFFFLPCPPPGLGLGESGLGSFVLAVACFGAVLRSLGFAAGRIPVLTVFFGPAARFFTLVAALVAAGFLRTASTPTKPGPRPL